MSKDLYLVFIKRMNRIHKPNCVNIVLTTLRPTYELDEKRKQVIWTNDSKQHTLTQGLLVWSLGENTVPSSDVNHGNNLCLHVICGSHEYMYIYCGGKMQKFWILKLKANVINTSLWLQMEGDKEGIKGYKKPNGKKKNRGNIGYEIQN